MALAAIYTVWDNLELLPGSIDQIYRMVDNIIIVYQQQSWYGVDNHNLEKELEGILAKDIEGKMEFIEYRPGKKNVKLEEEAKHNMGILHARLLGAEYFFLAACDHYYDPEQFEAAYKAVIDNDYDVTVSKMYTYYKSPEWQLDHIEGYYATFICKLQRDTAAKDGKYPVLVDSACMIRPYNNFYEFKESELMLHHYSFVRKNIEMKLQSAVKNGWHDKIDHFVKEHKNYNIAENPGISFFNNWKVKKVKNKFGIVHF